MRLQVQQLQTNLDQVTGERDALSKAFKAKEDELSQVMAELQACTAVLAQWAKVAAKL